MTYELKNTDVLDLEDLILKVENSFGIKFQDTELSHIKTFGEFCDYIADKIPYTNVQNCTSQQAFYKLKNAIIHGEAVNSELIYPNTKLEEIFPKQNRKLKIKQIEEKLGFKLSILQPPTWLSSFLIILALTSFVYLFINFKTGVISFIVSVLAIKITYENANEFSVKTLREVAEKMTRENYRKSRRDSKTFNKDEVENILTELFKEELALDVLNRESSF